MNFTKDQFRAAVRALIHAEKDYSWKGAATPEDREEIESRLKKAQQKFDGMVDQLFPQLVEPDDFIKALEEEDISTEEFVDDHCVELLETGSVSDCGYLLTLRIQKL